MNRVFDLLMSLVTVNQLELVHLYRFLWSLRVFHIFGKCLAAAPLLWTRFEGTEEVEEVLLKTNCNNSMVYEQIIKFLHVRSTRLPLARTCKGNPMSLPPVKLH